MKFRGRRRDETRRDERNLGGGGQVKRRNLGRGVRFGRAVVLQEFLVRRVGHSYYLQLFAGRAYLRGLLEIGATIPVRKQMGGG